MDTCLILTELNPTTVEAGLKKAREYLRRFSCTEHQNDEYKETVARAVHNWSAFARDGLHEGLAALLSRPYQWLRLAGEIEIEGNRHGIELFLYPIAGTKAAAAISFSAGVYDAVFRFQPSVARVIDLNVKRDVLGLALLLATSFSASALALKPLTDDADLLLPLQVADVKDWLVTPTQATIRRWPFLLAGIQTELVDRRQVEKQWPAEQLLQSSAGYLIYDGLV